jgi:hypothetical protein
MSYTSNYQRAKDLLFGTLMLGVFIAAEHYDIRMQQRALNTSYDGKKYSDLRDAPDAPESTIPQTYSPEDYSEDKDSELRRAVNEFISVQNEKYFSELQRRNGR